MGDIEERLEWTVGDRLRKAREASGLTRVDLAERLGVNRKTIQRWEEATSIGHGSGGLTAAKVHAWSAETEAPFDWLAGDDFTVPEQARRAIER